MERSPLVDIVMLRSGEVAPLAVEHLIIRRTSAGHFGLFGVLDDDTEEFAVTGESYTSEARALDAAHAFALSMQVGRIYVAREN